MVQKNKDLSKQRLDQINSLKSSIEALTEYFNEAFTGNASIPRQDSSIENILDLVSSIQGAALQIRELNSKLVLNHQMVTKQNQLQMLNAAYQKMARAMNAMQSVMALDDHNMDLIDNSDFDGPINKQLANHINQNDGSESNGGQSNFSQPGQDPAAKTVSDDDFLTDNVEPLSSVGSSVEPASDVATQDTVANSSVDNSTEQVTQPTEPEEEASATPVQSTTVASEDDVADSQSAKTPTEPAKPVASEVAQQPTEAEEPSQPKSDGGQSTTRQANDAIKVPDVSSSDGVQSSEEEYERHKREALKHSERIKKRLAQAEEEQAPAHHRLAIKWADAKNFVTKDGHVLKDVKDNQNVRDVTPQDNKSDQAAIDNMLNNEMNKL